MEGFIRITREHRNGTPITGNRVEKNMDHEMVSVLMCLYRGSEVDPRACP